MAGQFDLTRFLAAQDQVYREVLQELRAGRKRSHWMWFIFPQVQGLGHSPTAKRYAIASWAEAVAYAAHPVLGHRLRECSRLLLSTSGQSAEQVLGHTDAQKLASSMTLFQAAAPGETLFGQVLEKFYGGVPDPATESMVSSWRRQPPGARDPGPVEP